MRLRLPLLTMLLSLAVAACAESDTVTSDAAAVDASSAIDAAVSSDAAAHDGGAAHDGSSGPDSALPDAGATCNLPPETGMCEAYFERYAWNPEHGACEKFVYGGCGGNANNFETALECLAACAPEPDAGAARPAACKVGDRVYPSGARGVQDPHSCNKCLCADGQLVCTEIHCPTECPPNGKPAVGCAACGPVDNCEIVEYGCFPVCGTADDCQSTPYGLCLDDVCKNVCG